MRLKADVWVHAYLRICAGQDAVATVVRHGDDDAGAIYIKVSRLDRTAALYGPAPAGFAEVESDRRWTLQLPAGTDEGSVDAHLARQAEYDSDLWIVEVEDKRGRHFLDDWLAR